MKNSIIAQMAILLLGSIPSCFAATMYVGGYGGSTEKVFRETIIPAFEARHGVKIVYVPGNSTDTLSKLQAQKDKQELSVALIDDGPMAQAVSSGLCAKLDFSPVLGDIYYEAMFNGFRSIGLGFIATGLVFNTEIFKNNGWPNPSSWKDLENRKFQGKVVIPPITNGYGLLALVVGAHINGGGEYAIDPGFDYLVNKVGPNVHSWEGSPEKMTQLLQSGEAVIGVWGNGRVQTMVDKGYPVKFIYPKEGAVAIVTAACVVEGAPQPALGQTFLQYLLSEEIQELLAVTQGWGPVNKRVKLNDEIAHKVVFGPERVSKLISVDYRIINMKRPDWTVRWSKSIRK